eukprot:758641-Hanusia_phi.AAC.1
MLVRKVCMPIRRLKTPELVTEYVASRMKIALHKLPTTDYLGDQLLTKYGSQSRAYQFFAGSGWDGIPPQVDPYYHLPEKRKLRKRDQLMSMLRAATPLVTLFFALHGDQKRWVDFCGGAGHLGLLAAYLFPDWEIVCVDRKDFSLQMGRSRAEELGLSNYRTVRCDVLNYHERFDIGTALHACGSATDFSIFVSKQQCAAIVAASCCVGKVFDANRKAPALPGNSTTASWGTARSSKLQGLLEQYARMQDGTYKEQIIQDYFVKLRSFADSNTESELAAVAKLVVETDRLQGILENSSDTPTGCEYSGLVCKMEPESATPKNDILVAWPARFNVDVSAWGDVEVFAVGNSSELAKPSKGLQESECIETG